MRATLAIQAVGYVALMALVYGWLGISDRSVAQVLLSALLGLAIVFATVWLVGSALAAEPLSLQRLPRFVIWIAAAAAVVVCCVWLAGYRPRVGFSVASHLTLWFRRPVKPPVMGAIYTGVLWIAGAAGVLALLPRAIKVRPTRRYWIGSALLVLAGYWLPGLLIGWVPKFQSFGAQTASMIVRFALAYAIALAAWLSITALARRGRSAATA
jgi:hypothetical protein